MFVRCWDPGKPAPACTAQCLQSSVHHHHLSGVGTQSSPPLHAQHTVCHHHCLLSRWTQSNLAVCTQQQSCSLSLTDDKRVSGVYKATCGCGPCLQWPVMLVHKTSSMVQLSTESCRPDSSMSWGLTEVQQTGSIGMNDSTLLTQLLK